MRILGVLLSVALLLTLPGLAAQKQRVEAYGKVWSNLSKHAEGFPTAGSLRDVIKSGRPEFGMAGVGQGKGSEGSRQS